MQRRICTNGCYINYTYVDRNRHNKCSIKNSDLIFFFVGHFGKLLFDSGWIQNEREF